LTPFNPKAEDGIVSDELKHVTVLFEDLRGEIRAVADGHLLLNQKMDAMQADLTVVRGDVADLKTDVAVLKERMGRVEGHLELNGTKPAKRPRRR
jgi:hypothetical protein